MAAPTQEFPPWLTPIPSVIVDGNGVPITTSTTIMFLPLTYYGPSIPLGPDWTYGGLTSPASTSTTSSPSMATTAIPTPSLTTAIPPSSSSSSLSTSSSSSISTTNFPSSTNPVTSPSISPSTTIPPTSTATTPPAAGRLTRGQLVGVIVASILGFIFLLVLFLAFYLFCKGKKRRRARTGGGRGIDDDYVSVGAGGRLPGEGSPRHSGEEADPFLRPRGGGGAAAAGEKGTGSKTYSEMGARPPVPPKNVSRVPPPPNTSLSSNGSSSTGSGYGEPLAQPTLGIRPIREEHEQEMVGGRVLTPEEMQRLGDESVLPHDSDPEASSNRYSGAYAYTDVPNLPPPKLVAAAPKTSDYTLPRIPPPKRPSQGSHRSSLPLDVDENATLLTARRVKVEDLGPRSSPGSSPTEEGPSKSSPSSFLGTLGAIAGKMSWRKSQSPRTSQQQQPLLESSPLSDQDVEQGRIPPTLRPQMRETVTTASSRGGLSVGLGPDGSRPLSSVSGKSQNSGGTIYHDALSSIPSMPSTPILTPLPRIATPSDAPPLPILGAQRPATPAHIPAGTTAATPQAEDEHSLKNVNPNSPGGTSYAHTLVPDFDILDMPAPSALSLFGGASAVSLKPSMGSDAATAVGQADTSFSTLRPYYPLPPGLDLIPTPKTWAEMSPGDTPSPGSFGGDQENGVGEAVVIDILEEEPPAAGENWRSMASTATSGGDNSESERLARRTTFGLPQYVHQPDFKSEQASLYSMRSHLSPASPPRSTGSAPASSTRRDPSYGSSSSRPSAGGSSGAISYAQSLARTGSITSDGRRRGFGTGPISPALSVFGHHQVRSGSGSGGSGGGDVFMSREGSASASGSGEGGVGVVVGLQSPSTAYLAPMRNASNSSSPPMSPLSMPWAAGLDDSWNASS